MFILFVSELNYYISKEVHQELFVDTSKGQKLQINVDMTFTKIGCSFLSLDAMDVSGEQQIDVLHHMMKQRLTSDGKPVEAIPEKGNLGDPTKDFVDAVQKPVEADRCESCYGAESLNRRCCNTCEEVREAYRQKGWAINNMDNIEQCKREGWEEKFKSEEGEGCRIYGYLEVNKVAGNFHIAPGKSFQQHHVHVHDLQAFGGKQFDLSHKISHLSFGMDYPGQVNPLDHTTESTEHTSVMFQYFVKIVPTTYVKANNKMIQTSQFSVTKHQRILSTGGLGESGLPGVFFMYELSPMMVKYTEKHRSFMHFLTGVCAIIGGVFTVAGLIDSMIYHSARAIQKKIELGKAN
ncbi:Endoplasmic reticulum-Golgi intermediate compartment protein 3 [Lamellibrachia satsuma]|nr:Endoplasmic reticulum-Golgi intermediate compartment protein 3 [Lamellibrachia satsuma]